MYNQLHQDIKGAVVVDYPSIGGVPKVAIKQSIYLKYPLIALCKYKPWKELLDLVPSFSCLSDIRLSRLYRTVNVLFSIYWRKVSLGAELYITHQLSSSWFAFRRRLKLYSIYS